MNGVAIYSAFLVKKYDYILKNNYKVLKFKGVYLTKYCKIKELEYRSITSSLYYIIKHNTFPNLTTSEKLELIISRYKIRKEIKNLKNLFIDLIAISSKKEIRELCLKLDINYLKLVYNKKLDIKKLIILTWFSHDKKNKKGVYISKSKFKNIYDIKNLGINDLCGLCKIGSEEAKELLIKQETHYIKGIIKKVIRRYNFKIQYNDYEDLFNQGYQILLECINKVVLSEPPRIICYFKKCISMKILAYLKESHSNRFIEYNDELKNDKFLEFS